MTAELAALADGDPWLYADLYRLERERAGGGRAAGPESGERAKQARRPARITKRTERAGP